MEAKWVQGFHYGTIRGILEAEYGIPRRKIILEDEYCDEVGRFWAVFHAPIQMEQLKLRHLKKVHEPTEKGVRFLVRNYHAKKFVREKTEDEIVNGVEEEEVTLVKKPERAPLKVVSEEEIQERIEEQKLKQAEKYWANREKLLAYARKRYQINKLNPAWVKKHRDAMREHRRAKNNIKVGSEEVIRRNEIKRQYEESSKLTADEWKEKRIAELMVKDDQGVISEAEILELEGLLS